MIAWLIDVAWFWVRFATIAGCVAVIVQSWRDLSRDEPKRKLELPPIERRNRKVSW